MKQHHAQPPLIVFVQHVQCVLMDQVMRPRHVLLQPTEYVQLAHHVQQVPHLSRHHVQSLPIVFALLARIVQQDQHIRQHHAQPLLIVFVQHVPLVP